MSDQGSTFYADFYPSGFRKLFAVSLICATTLIPTLLAWKNGPEQVPLHGVGGGRSFGGGLAGPRWGGGDGGQPSASSRLPIGRTILAMFGGALGLMIYYPRRGFKRYALVCGPILGLGSMILTGWYLAGRVQVYRFETVFAALIGGSPGVAFYVLLARRKWYKKQPNETLWIE